MNSDRSKKIKEMEFFTEYGDANRYKILEVIGKGSYGVGVLQHYMVPIEFQVLISVRCSIIHFYLRHLELVRHKSHHDCISKRQVRHATLVDHIPTVLDLVIYRYRSRSCRLLISSGSSTRYRIPPST